MCSSKDQANVGIPANKHGNAHSNPDPDPIFTKGNFIIPREQRESLELINIGTFLEYFDSKVYIHVTVILNTLFFPKTNPYPQ